MKKAFTLAEIMIVLTVIGVLTAILLPVAFQAAPDENAMKFKKANSTLGTMIRELVNSDRYYADGDLGMKAGGAAGVSGTQIKGDNDAEKRYFCMSLADIMSTQSVNCSKEAGDTSNKFASLTEGASKATPTTDMVKNIKDKFDTACAGKSAIAVGAEIISADNVVWYQVAPATTFGAEETSGATKIRTFAAPNAKPGKDTYQDVYGFDVNYKIICIDVDGIDNGEAPFGYGIRADGRILPGKRADDWIQKSVQQQNN